MLYAPAPESLTPPTGSDAAWASYARAVADAARERAGQQPEDDA